jgi:LemA protein
MKGTWIALGVLGAIALLVLGAIGSAVGTYNAFVKETESVDAQSKQVDVQYQRAFRLLPQLAALTDKYMKNERAVQENVTALRSGLGHAQNGSFEAKDAFLQKFVSFVALVGNRAEAYPDLKADQLFQQTMLETTNTENKIAAEKVRYNDRVQQYNAHRRECCVPAIVAGMFGFGAKEYIGFNDRANQQTFPTGATP